MDTGASVNIIDGNTYNKIKENVYLEKSNTNRGVARVDFWGGAKF